MSESPIPLSDKVKERIAEIVTRELKGLHLSIISKLTVALEKKKREYCEVFPESTPPVLSKNHRDALPSSPEKVDILNAFRLDICETMEAISTAIKQSAETHPEVQIAPTPEGLESVWIAQFSYTNPHDSDELDFEEEDIFVDVVLIGHLPGWLMATHESSGLRGQIPGNYVEQYFRVVSDSKIGDDEEESESIPE